MNKMEYLLGHPVLRNSIVSPYIREQFRFTRTKKKRVMKKFKKDPKNFKSSVNVYMVNGTLIMHPDVYAQIKRQTLSNITGME